MAKTRGAKRTNWKQEFNDAAEEVEILRAQVNAADVKLQAEWEAHCHTANALEATRNVLARAKRRLSEAAEHLATLNKPAAAAAIRADIAELI